MGYDLIDRLSPSHELATYDIDLDITDGQRIMQVIPAFKPDVVLHAAAYTDVDGCESDSDTAYLVNTIGAQNVAFACRLAGAAMVYISTDFVFDGTKGSPYDEFDVPNPISVYGRSKLAGETLVKEVLPEHYIVRTAWMFGNAGGNFVKTMIRLADEKDEVRVVDDQLGSPTFSLDLARRISELISTGWYGTYHVTNAGSASWNGFARKILEVSGRDPEKIKPMSSSELDRPARRPPYSVLRNMMCELRGLSPMPSYEDALREFFARPMSE